jgi:hypothetical protein
MSATLPSVPPAAGARRRRLALAALVAAVSLVHLQLAEELSALRIDSGAADSGPPRIEVRFVRELQPSEPPPVVLAPRPQRRAAAPPPPEPAASAPEPPPKAPEPDPAPDAEPGPASMADAGAAVAPPEPVAGDEGALPPAPVGAAEPLPADAAASAAAFEWPPSTRLSYTLSGHYRGPLEGTASVEWLRSGTRYQVHLDVAVGPAIAPLITRRMSSDGELTDAGLRPGRYDEETRIAWREVRRATIRFEPGIVRLAGGRVAEALPGLQDSASQFVQMSWLFTLHPERLQPGGSVEMPLALPRRVGRWVYDVVGEELLETPVGRVAAVKLTPRLDSARVGELTVQAWFAPTLQYLPVRLLIRQDAESHLDLMLARLPQQAAAAAPAAPAPPAPPPPAPQSPPVPPEAQAL